MDKPLHRFQAKSTPAATTQETFNELRHQKRLAESKRCVESIRRKAAEEQVTVISRSLSNANHARENVEERLRSVEQKYDEATATVQEEISRRAGAEAIAKKESSHRMEAERSAKIMAEHLRAAETARLQAEKERDAVTHHHHVTESSNLAVAREQSQIMLAATNMLQMQAAQSTVAFAVAQMQNAMMMETLARSRIVQPAVNNTIYNISLQMGSYTHEVPSKGLENQTPQASRRVRSRSQSHRQHHIGSSRRRSRSRRRRSQTPSPSIQYQNSQTDRARNSHSRASSRNRSRSPVRHYLQLKGLTSIHGRTGHHVDAVILHRADGSREQHGGQTGDHTACLEFGIGEVLTEVVQAWKTNSYLGRQFQFTTNFGRKALLAGSVGLGKKKAPEYLRYRAPKNCCIVDLKFDASNKLVDVLYAAQGR